MNDSAAQIQALADQAVLDTIAACAFAAQVDFGGRVGTAHGPAEIAEALRRPWRGSTARCTW